MFIDEKTRDISQKALAISRDELYSDIPFFNMALSELKYKSDDRLKTTATDGEFLLYPVQAVINSFEKNPIYLNRIYLHSMLHCLFGHLWLRGDRDKRLWGIACDIAVEYTIDRLDKPSVKRVLSLVRTTTYAEIEALGRGVSAAIIYHDLLLKTDDQTDVLYREFFTDDHVYWPTEKRLDNKQMMLKKRWSDIGRQTENKRRSGHDDGEGGSSVSYQIRASKTRRDYRVFLRDFLVYSEEMELDPEEFDISTYMYGLHLYKNMPLIESLETREISKIKDLVIVVDTSYSTNGELVRGFLKQTFSILKDTESFFRTNRVHLIQADDEVREDIVLEDEDQIERLFMDFSIKGGGNTDFRPAFGYVESLREEGAFDKLCGLLYFTDGMGVYPEEQPDYKTAFVFLDEYEENKVPPWAIKIVLDESAFITQGG